MIFFWREFSERPKFLLKNYEKYLKVNLNLKNNPKNLSLHLLSNFLIKDLKKTNNFYIIRKKSEIKYPSFFLGRMVGIDKKSQNVSISTGIKKDGIFKIPKNIFIDNITKLFENETNDEAIFYLPFYNDPHKETLSKRFMKANIGNLEDEKKKKKCVWENWRKTLKFSINSYLYENKIPKFLISSKRTTIKISRKRKKFIISRMLEKLYEKGKNMILWKSERRKTKIESRFKRKLKNRKKYEILLLEKGNNSLNWLKERNELFIHSRITTKCRN